MRWDGGVFVLVNPNPLQQQQKNKTLTRDVSCSTRLSGSLRFFFFPAQCKMHNLSVRGTKSVIMELLFCSTRNGECIVVSFWYGLLWRAGLFLWTVKYSGIAVVKEWIVFLSRFFSFLQFTNQSWELFSGFTRQSSRLFFSFYLRVFI